VFSRPVNVCHLGKYYPPAPGGIESHVRTLARAQAALGANVRVVCVNHSDREGRDVTWARYGATKTIEEKDGAVSVVRLGRSACVARFDIIPGLLRLLHQIQYSNADIVHLHMPNPTMLLTLAGLRLNKPIVVTHHSDIVSQRLLVHVMRPLERIVYRRAAAIVSTSAGYIDGSQVLQNNLDKVETLPLGIELSPYLHPSPAVRAEEGRLRQQFGDQPLWLSVGRCVVYKGLHTAMEAMPRIRGRWMIIGSGPLLKSLQEQARQLGVQDRVIFRGFATDSELAAAYRAATALLFPSCLRSEGFGLVQVEAMASGCPVINTSIFGSGVPWVSLHDKTGLTIPINDHNALAAACNRLLNEPRLRDRLSSQAIERASEEFSDDLMAHRCLAIYARLLRQAQSSGRTIDAVSPAPAKLEAWVRDATVSTKWSVARLAENPLEELAV